MGGNPNCKRRLRSFSGHQGEQSTLGTPIAGTRTPKSPVSRPCSSLGLRQGLRRDSPSLSTLRSHKMRPAPRTGMGHPVQEILVGLPGALPRQCGVGKRTGCPTWCLTSGNQGCACASPRLDGGGVGELPQTCCRPAAASATGPTKCGAWLPPTAPAEKAPSKGLLSLPLTQNLKKNFF